MSTGAIVFSIIAALAALLSYKRGKAFIANTYARKYLPVQRQLDLAVMILAGLLALLCAWAAYLAETTTKEASVSCPQYEAPASFPRKFTAEHEA